MNTITVIALVVMMMMMMVVMMTESLNPSSSSLSLSLSLSSSSSSSSSLSRLRSNPIVSQLKRSPLYASDSPWRGTEGTSVEHRRGTSIDDADDVGVNNGTGRRGRNSLGSGADERIINDDSNIHEDLSNIVRAFQQSELLLSLTTNDISTNDKLSRISLATKDDLVSKKVVSGIIHEEKAIESFQLNAAGLFADWDDDGRF